jgi:hypothetical protein
MVDGLIELEEDTKKAAFIILASKEFPWYEIDGNWFLLKRDAVRHNPLLEGLRAYHLIETRYTYALGNNAYIATDPMLIAAIDAQKRRSAKESGGAPIEGWHLF